MNYSSTMARMACALILIVTSNISQAQIDPGEPFLKSFDFDFIYDIEFRPDGNLWVAGDGPHNSWIVRFDAETGEFAGTFLQAPLTDQIRNFAFNKDGVIYVVTAGFMNEPVLWRVDSSGVMVPVLTANQLAGEVPTDIAFEPGTDNLYIALFRQGEILKYDTSSVPDLVSTAGLATVITTPDTGLLEFLPRSMLWAPAAGDSDEEQLYITEENFGLMRYNIVTRSGEGGSETTSGEYDSSFAQSGFRHLVSSTHIALGPDGNLYVSVTHHNTVTRFHGPGAVDDMKNSIEGIEIDSLNKFVSPATDCLVRPFGLDFGPDGRLYIASNRNSGANVLIFDGPFGDEKDEFCVPVVDEEVPEEEVPEEEVLDVADVLDIINDLLADPITTDKAAKDLEDAIKKLDKALEKLAEGDEDKALKDISKAVKDLEKAEDDGAVVDGLIGVLVDTSRTRAQEAIDVAIAAGGDPKEIDKAMEEMGKAQAELDDNDPDKAIDKYKKALQKAEKAL